MKKFEDICRMTQAEVKEYMMQYLTSKNYTPISEDGFLYAKGDLPVLLVAHMDTVHTKVCEEIITLNGKISSPQGIGGDDRCGIYIIANLVKDLHCSVLLCEDEEIGMIGAKKFTKTEYIDKLDVNYMIEFDRKGTEDAVFYSCANKEFQDFVIKETGNKKAWGTFSDISTLMPASGLCGVNLSCGYFNPHTLNEYVDYNTMLETIYVAQHLIKAECKKPFEYETYSSNGYDYYDDWAADYYKSVKTTAKQTSFKLADRIAKDTYLELEVIVFDEDFREKILYASGDTKKECWFNFFTENPDICINDIEDYNFM